MQTAGIQANRCGTCCLRSSWSLYGSLHPSIYTFNRVSKRLKMPSREACFIPANANAAFFS